MVGGVCVGFYDDVWFFVDFVFVIFVCDFFQYVVDCVGECLFVFMCLLVDVFYVCEIWIYYLWIDVDYFCEFFCDVVVV